MGMICQRCGESNPRRMNRYCSPCTRIVMTEIAKSGYFQSTYAPRIFSEERGRKGMRDPRVLGGVPH